MVEAKRFGNMNTALDIWLIFPIDECTEPEFKRLTKFCGSIENTEEAFDIEFSCGDGRYLSDMQDDEDELEEYDGRVCTNYPPRERASLEQLKSNKIYRFTAKYSEKNEQIIYFLNGKKKFTKWVG